jgi:hypothetical protein
VKVLPAAVLLLEAIAVALAIPVAVTTSARGATTGWVFGLLAIALVVAAGMARRPSGVAVGWALQVAVIATGLLVPAMLALGLVFLAVWITALVYGGKADRVAAQHRASTAPTEPPAASATDGPPTSG